ncbi:(2Fe-2S)-binding protein [Streptacidiphilus jiangxiensis]|uniref:2Fe-2S iron-sulfur cluster binding domain-containing protein n=1 Tax=Streptacidiphilus jiangxiensis TaxID=235985 RepID=A0A1H7YLQ4_STRJI|nr:(2Fe-2S)-binding protein [Streptacidiphilus jiangxiensis]SEM46764.1 2Fe-2S iron-sulfur cluster binding domain-containing protein [Streptacidiphilus jiangxiensis]
MRRNPLDLVRARPEPGFEFSFDGEPVPALPGQTVAAALWQADRLAWRRTRVGDRPRGAFCGMGACYDCLVELDGVPNVRACLAPVTPGAEVRTQRGDGHDELA